MKRYLITLRPLAAVFALTASAVGCDDGAAVEGGYMDASVGGDGGAGGTMGDGGVGGEIGGAGGAGGAAGGMSGPPPELVPWADPVWAGEALGPSPLPSIYGLYPEAWFEATLSRYGAENRPKSILSLGDGISAEPGRE